MDMPNFIENIVRGIKDIYNQVEKKPSQTINKIDVSLKQVHNVQGVICMHRNVIFVA